MYTYNPYDMQRYQQNLIRVTGIEGAKAYQMPPNSVVALFDANEDMFYVKSSDGAGFPTIRSFKFEEVVPTQMSVANENYVTKKEMKEYVEQLIQQAKQNANINADGD